MTLVARLLAFFLTTLAMILVGFSLAIYLLASEYLHRQAAARLGGTLDALVAAAEVKPLGVEWEPRERRLPPAAGIGAAAVPWLVLDGRGRRVDGAALDWLAPAGPGDLAAERRPRVLHAPGGPWLVESRRLEPAEHHGRGPRPGRGHWHDALVFRAAVSLADARAALSWLGLGLATLSAAIWAVALLAGGRLCRRALRPLTAMAESARQIAGHELDERLPVPKPDDELADLGRSFNGLLDRRREAMERQRRFTGDASHQLRTPLTAILGQVDLALRQPRDPEEYRRVLGVVQARARHLRRIVEALLFLARADAEAGRPALESLDLAGWLGNLLDARAGDRPGAIRLELPDGGPVRARAHPALLGELVGNLLDNAAKYSPPGEPIVVRAGRSGGMASVAVVDRGIGIEPEHLDGVMTPFYRTPGARSVDSRGLGLGLAVADRIASALDGRIEVRSEPGRGSTFTLLLPADG